LDVNNTIVNVITDNISSGNDVSGTNYIVSSSYGSNVLVRGTPVTSIISSSTTESTNTNTTSMSTSSPSSQTSYS